MIPIGVLQYGKDEPLPERVQLRAGPLTLIYEAGDLRTIKLGDREVLRRIYVAVRDRLWGTLPNVLSDVEMTVGKDSFRISYSVENHQGEIDFRWRGTITGAPDGTLRFAMEGRAHTTFWRNRIGFCVLHPAPAAGARCVVEHVDGMREEGVLPTQIVPDQPVPPFADMHALSHEIAPGVWARVDFEGDVFEMEDQRNWTDASYKTFCTPLALPYPVEVPAGTRVAQSVTLRLEGQPTSVVAIGTAREEVLVDLGEDTVPLPPIGLGIASHGQPLTPREIERLRALVLAHLRVDLAPGSPGCAETLARAASEAEALGVPLHVALLIREDSQVALAELRTVLEGVCPPVAAWLVYPAREQFGGGSPVAQAVALARRHVADYDPAAPLVAGTNHDLILLQRSLPPLAEVDAVTFAIQPQSHAFDNASLMETLETQARVVRTARQLANGLPVFVSPVTLKRRANVHASGRELPMPPGELPPQVDERQMSLFGAAWTVGSIRYLAQGRASSVTYYETTGWRGVMETEAGPPAPDKFRSIPGAVFPLYHLLADVGEFAGGQMPETRSSDPLRADVLALQRGDRRCALVANTSSDPQRVTLRGMGEAGWVRVRVLDEATVVDAMRQPEAFRAGDGEHRELADGTLTLELLPYAVVRVDFGEGSEA
jgi:hypothetical protein